MIKIKILLICKSCFYMFLVKQKFWLNHKKFLKKFLFLTCIKLPVGNGASRQWRVFRAVHGGKPQFVALCLPDPGGCQSDTHSLYTA